MAVLPRHADLKQTYDDIRPSLKDADRDRLRRSLSWLERAEQCPEEDIDDRFLFYWISFCAAYSAPKAIGDKSSTEVKLSSEFIRDIVNFDHKKALHELMQARISHSIDLLVNNQYVYRPFWDKDPNWEKRFARDNAAMRKYYEKGDVANTFYNVLQRLHVLRNQIIHGGATWKSEVNRDQVKDGTYIMSRLVPTVLGIMLKQMVNNPEVSWGPVAWPSQSEAYAHSPSDTE